MINWGNFWLFFKTGVPSWVLYTSLLLMFAIISLGYCSKYIGNKKRFTLWAVLVEYVFIVACSTIICRDIQSFEFSRLELMPFWTYAAVIKHTPGVSVWDIVLNIVLFLPLGILINMLYPKLSIYKVLLIGVVCSSCIELSQYIFEKGLVQTDDIMHNSFGCVLGFIFTIFVMGFKRKKVEA